MESVITPENGFLLGNRDWKPMKRRDQILDMDHLQLSCSLHPAYTSDCRNSALITVNRCRCSIYDKGRLWLCQTGRFLQSNIDSRS